jgi:hypothetical protein
MLFTAIGCFQATTQKNGHEKPMDLRKDFVRLDENGVIRFTEHRHLGFFQRLNDFILHNIQYLHDLFKEKEKLPSYCEVILRESPTVEEFVRNWHPQGKISSCSLNVSKSCIQKNNDAFAQAMHCYQ